MMDIKVYEVAHKTLGSKIIYDNPQEAIEEIKTHIKEGEVGDLLNILIYKMEKENYENLAEFQGW